MNDARRYLLSLLGVAGLALAGGCAVYIPMQTSPVHDGKALGVNNVDAQCSVSRVTTYRCDLTAVAWFVIEDPQIDIDVCESLLMAASARYGIADRIDIGGGGYWNMSALGGEIFAKVQVTDTSFPLAVAVVPALGYAGGSWWGGEGTAYAESDTRLHASAVHLLVGVPLSYDPSPDVTLKAAANLHYSILEASGDYTAKDRYGTYSGHRGASRRILAPSYCLGLDVIGLGIFVRWYDRNKPLWGFSVGSAFYRYITGLI